jgi:hypothetical protein
MPACEIDGAQSRVAPTRSAGAAAARVACRRERERERERETLYLCEIVAVCASV